MEIRSIENNTDVVRQHSASFGRPFFSSHRGVSRCAIDWKDANIRKLACGHEEGIFDSTLREDVVLGALIVVAHILSFFLAILEHVRFHTIDKINDFVFILLVEINRSII